MAIAAVEPSNDPTRLRRGPRPRDVPTCAPLSPLFSRTLSAHRMVADDCGDERSCHRVVARVVNTENDVRMVQLPLVDNVVAVKSSPTVRDDIAPHLRAAKGDDREGGQAARR